MILLPALLSACAANRPYEPPKADLAGAIEAAAADTSELPGWRDFYRNETLRALIREGLERNGDLEIARLRVDEALAALRGARGLLWPAASLAYEGNISRARGGETERSASFGPSFSWEPDLFRRQGNAVEAARAAADERAASARFERTRLIAAIAQSWYALGMLAAQREVTRQALAAWDEQIGALRALMEAGESDGADIGQAEASRYEAEATLQQIDRRVIETQSGLATLLGRKRADIPGGAFSPGDFSDELAESVPVAALAARPDILQAEAGLRAAFHRTNAARAAFYPSLRLTASAGWTNSEGLGIAHPAVLFARAAASLVQPLLDQGQNRANLAVAESQEAQALVAFQHKVIEAGNEVNKVQRTCRSAARTVELQGRQIGKLEEALRAAEARMRHGDGNVLQILVVRQALLAARLQRLASEYELIESHIALFRALGGGADDGADPRRARGPTHSSSLTVGRTPRPSDATRGVRSSRK